VVLYFCVIGFSGQTRPTPRHVRKISKVPKVICSGSVGHVLSLDQEFSFVTMPENTSQLFFRFTRIITLKRGGSGDGAEPLSGDIKGGIKLARKVLKGNNRGKLNQRVIVKVGF